MNVFTLIDNVIYYYQQYVEKVSLFLTSTLKFTLTVPISFAYALSSCLLPVLRTR